MDAALCAIRQQMSQQGQGAGPCMRLQGHRLADTVSLTIMESTEYLWASETMNWTSLVSCWNCRLGYQPLMGPSEAVMAAMHLFKWHSITCFRLIQICPLQEW